MQALDELWRRRILRETEGDSYDFTHEKLREVCYDNMSAARRRLAQRLLAAAQEVVFAKQSDLVVGQVTAHRSQRQPDGVVTQH